MSSAYVDALRLLAARELSESQVRRRLARKGHEEVEVDAAIERLKLERALDDERVAAAVARTETHVKRRGRLRVRRQIESAGISAEVARRATEAAFAEVDDDALVESALGRRLKGDRAIENQREFERLYRFLAGQGFETDQILRALNRRRRPTASEEQE
jgi:regulatory protein